MSDEGLLTGMFEDNTKVRKLVICLSKGCFSERIVVMYIC